MDRRKGPIELILGSIAILAFFGVVITVMLQIVTRRMDTVSFVWTEELSRFFFVLGIAAATPLAYKSGDFVYIEFLIDHPENKAKRFMKIAVQIITFLVFGAIVLKGFSFISLGIDQKSSAMAIPMAIPYAFIVGAAIFIECHIIHNFYTFIKKEKK